MSASHPQIRQRKQRHQLCHVLDQTTEARLHITELTLDHSEREFDLRPYLRFGFSISRLILNKTLRLPIFW